ncbi:unnamed protein product [Spirodela intermedia]|uniref:Disease resistance R13L4/SHOC-2-like LRR domain-containing protein n=1 Tax=Spirodela intermedia TaxID=51605 RepID=A0A7I8JQS2_SPIIN|nr:unnamed protein product [Spirodela intermedia]CAA6672135.1 unnamed protein product [Spirodela intermedia]
MAFPGVVLGRMIFVLVVIASSCLERKVTVEGITCDFNTGRVVGIDLSSQMLRVVPGATWYLNHTMLATFGQLESLNLGYNDITGGIPESNISSCLCTMRSLRVLSLAYNSLKGSIPSCLCTLRSLRILYLEGNSLEGSIPSCMCTLRSLRKLYLSNNRLSGDIPSCFSNIRTLTELGLSDNKFQGNYISWLCDMRSLTVLSLSYDRFPSSIPSCLGNLDKLKFLQLAGDEFKCSMPSSIFSNLTKLRTLKIYCGGLKGTFQFPVLANLSKLKYIYFSSNGGLDINTEYPISWVPSFQLNTFIIQDCSLNRNTFSVAFNILFGGIPSGGQFATFSKSSYEDFDDALFYSFVTISFILGFWWFLASIFFKVSWRRKYFKIIDEYYKMYLRDI